MLRLGGERRVHPAIRGGCYLWGDYKPLLAVLRELCDTRVQNPRAPTYYLRAIRYLSHLSNPKEYFSFGRFKKSFFLMFKSYILGHRDQVWSPWPHGPWELLEWSQRTESGLGPEALLGAPHRTSYPLKQYPLFQNQRDSTISSAPAMHVADPASISSTLYSPLNTTRSDP